jgi:hypothetical protein
MVRVKNARNVDTRQAALVDGAYYAAKAPKGGHNAARRKKRPPLQVWGRAALHQPKLYGAFWIAYSSQAICFCWQLVQAALPKLESYP